MKKIYVVIVFLTILSSCSTQSERRSEAILSSTDINEVSEYLKTAHPEDPKKKILEAKLIALKNKEWTKGAANAKPMEARPVLANLPGSVSKRNSEKFDEEFKALITESPTEHQNKTKELLNSLVNQDINKTEAIFLFKNNSDCNLILKINGKKFYNLAVPAHNENFIILDKDLYTISTDVCDVKYTTQKMIKNHLQLSINNPIFKSEEETKNKISKPTVKKVIKKSGKSGTAKKKR